MLHAVNKHWKQKVVSWGWSTWLKSKISLLLVWKMHVSKSSRNYVWVMALSPTQWLGLNSELVLFRYLGIVKFIYVSHIFPIDAMIVSLCLFLFVLLRGSKFDLGQTTFVIWRRLATIANFKNWAVLQWCSIGWASLQWASSAWISGAQSEI